MYIIYDVATYRSLMNLKWQQINHKKKELTTNRKSTRQIVTNTRWATVSHTRSLHTHLWRLILIMIPGFSKEIVENCEGIVRNDAEIARDSKEIIQHSKK